MTSIQIVERKRRCCKVWSVAVVSLTLLIGNPSQLFADPVSAYTYPNAIPERTQSKSAEKEITESLGPEDLQENPDPLMAAAQHDPLDDILQSIVTVNAEILDIARTASSFGLKREGSGIVIDANGLIATVGYIIAEASSVSVTFSDGEASSAEIIAYDEATGLGLLRANKQTPTMPITLGKSSELKSDQQALILPAAGEQEARTVTIGKIKRFTGGWEYIVDGAIHTYPPSTNFGGSALLSDKGELLGIGALVTIDIDIDPKVRVPGNIFVPIDALTGVLGELLTDGRSKASIKPWLGLDSKQTSKGIVVGAVIAEGPAAESGIQPGDVIVAVDQKKVSSLAQMYELIWSAHVPGDKVHLLVIRDNQYANVPVASIDRYEWLRLQQNMDTAITEMTE